MKEEYVASQFNVKVSLENGDIILRNLFHNSYIYML